jgi:hypothetical protein
VRIGWLLGWAVPQDWFAALAREAFPAAVHAFVRPSAAAIGELEALAPFDWVAGYSLGTLLLIGHAARAEALGRVALLAPIFAFPSEENLGGRIPRVEIRILARRLRQDPALAIGEFHRRAGLGDIPEGLAAAAEEPGIARVGTVPSDCPIGGEDSLAWGLAQLETVRVDPVLPQGWVGWCGTDDPFLDAHRLQALDGRIVPLPRATHHPRALMSAFSAFVAKGPGRGTAANR